MELELRLGTSPARPLKKALEGGGGRRPSTGLKLGFCRAEGEKDAVEVRRGREVEERCSVDSPAQLNLLLPAHHLPGYSREMENAGLEVPARELDVNLMPSANSPASSDRMNFSGGGELGGAAAEERSSSRLSDEEENGGARKKLRLSKEQSAFLEESFKQHSTLKPKQKSALAKQLNLRPRQVEVWFQNRRARTKLKQTEVDCEYLKRCCEALTEENRRLQKELSELRALKATHPFYNQLPATTLSICASCESASKSTEGAEAGVATGGAASASGKAGPFTALFAKVHFHALTKPPPAPAHQPSAAS
ncbi:hypothetical protein IEQ34_019522 [Dendrobium chrysotoxum]|uniref:Homeobox domain-containing protein n=1 Tax=Dendrobium chrysotoxum TaxID=161865 RepID=A0AAV7GA85_DENCH|nr:hypothetical protein IEQ34_019522 [Dendrobium chrysotoxum]